MVDALVNRTAQPPRSHAPRGNASSLTLCVATRGAPRRVPTQERGNERLSAGTIVCRWIAIALVASQLLFAHGCHGDEDHELLGLLTSGSAWVPPWGRAAT